MKLPLILKQEENKKNPVDKKLEQNVWQEIVSSC